MTTRPAPNFPHGCFCGCGETANAGRHYRPGHDARHVKQAFAEWLGKRGLWGNRDSLDNYWRAVRQLPTQALRRKVRDRMRRFATRDEVISQVWELEKELRADPRWMRIRSLLDESDAEWAEGRTELSDRFVAVTAIAMGWTRGAVCRRRS